MTQNEKGLFGALMKASNFLNTLAEQMCIYTMAAMTLIVLLGVVFRYILLMPLSWSEELSRYLMIWAASIAISIGIKQNEHVGLTILIDSSRSKVIRSILATIIFLAVLAFLTVMVIYAVMMVRDSQYQISQGLGITMVLPTLAIPISMALAIIQLVFTYILRFRNMDAEISEHNRHNPKVIDI